MLLFDLKALLDLISTAERPKVPRVMRAFTSLELEDLNDLAAREARRVAANPARPPQLAAASARRVVNRLLKRATLLHTDIALLVPAAADRFAESSVSGRRLLLDLRSAVQIVDGRQVGFIYSGAHWDFTRLLLDEVTPDPAGDVAVRQWYRTVAALLAAQHQFAESNAHLARARRLFPADAEIVAASGHLHETFASPEIQNFLETGASAVDRRSAVGSARSNLRQSETFFRKAVELDGALAGARLHLGRVLGIQGHHQEAADELRRVTADGGSTSTQYYALAFPRGRGTIVGPSGSCP